MCVCGKKEERERREKRTLKHLFSGLLYCFTHLLDTSVQIFDICRDEHMCVCMRSIRVPITCTVRVVQDLRQ